ncbi:hypothetical protein VC83_04882 [Pseudogymnoascus destructans]|uniref:5'-3' DNA helicase ZGRF1-like N-terminal domain-containing protein n=2 Tax=Pseudogymnoascus destructans TaxID=655981 RepID=L8FZG1_PSED2|nr:uncharacterized protein VC83_04882 [Pseudogymnoascus destructans]ELR05919.1 hypothetical protein GMDG_07692 [Pseudogymnoascus destructans 20631-21]OAF58631.1 hypothetical protein VC83_04882 [Pseudogymnoascus destructans]
MASLVQHTPAASTAIPLTQNTAPVIEFRCLFTSDIRRKQKRWQDGLLKFHTFNKRVMVYDERLNFVGDTHWHDYHIDEGEELELDRAAVLVQVADCLGSRDQDLTELLDHRTKQREERAAVRRPSSSPAEVPFDNLRIARQPTAYSKLSQKPLSALLGTPTGHHGRALLPTTSPFEDRQKEQRQERDAQERPSKRRKAESTYSKAGYAQNLTGAMLDLSSTPHSTAPLRREPLWSKTSRRQEGVESSKEESHEVDLLLRGFQELPRQKRRQWQPLEKKAKSGFAQTLTGAVLDLSSTQNTNAFLRHHLPSTRNMGRGAPLESIPDRGRHQQSRNETVRPNVLQTPVVEKQSTNQMKAKKSAGSLKKSRAGNPSVTGPKGGQTTPGEVQQRDSVSASDEFLVIDDDFIDIDDIEQACRPQHSSISKSNDAREGGSDLHAISISPSPQVPPPEDYRRPVTIVPIKASEPDPDVANGPPETVGSIRLKSRPKRKMLLLNDSRQPQPSPVQASPRPIPPAEDVDPEQSQATKKLDAFHAQQKEQLRARAVKRKADVEQDDEGASAADNSSDRNRGLDGKVVGALPSKPDISVPKVPKETLSRQPQSERIVRQDHSTAVKEPPLLPTKGTSGRISRRSPETAPQSSEPAFKQLRNVADKLALAQGVALQTTSIKPCVPIRRGTTPEVKAPQTRTADAKVPRTRTSNRRRTEVSPIATTTLTATTSSPKDLPVDAPPKRSQITKPQLLMTNKTARSKIVVGWVGAPKEPVVIQTLPVQVPQRREASDVSWGVAQHRVAAQDVETSRFVPAKAQPLQDISLRRRPPIACKNAGKVAESGGPPVRSGSGPWSREAFDLFDWRPGEIG